MVVRSGGSCSRFACVLLAPFRTVGCSAFAPVGSFDVSLTGISCPLVPSRLWGVFAGNRAHASPLEPLGERCILRSLQDNAVERSCEKRMDTVGTASISSHTQAFAQSRKNVQECV